MTIFPSLLIVIDRVGNASGSKAHGSTQKERPTIRGTPLVIDYSIFATPSIISPVSELTLLAYCGRKPF